MARDIVGSIEPWRRAQRERYPEERERLGDILLKYNLPDFKSDMAEEIYQAMTEKVSPWRDAGGTKIGAYEVAPEEQALVQKLIGTARNLRGAEGQYGARNVDMGRALQRNKDLLNEFLGKAAMARGGITGQKVRQSQERMAHRGRKTWENKFWRSQDFQRKAAERERERAEEGMSQNAIMQAIQTAAMIAAGLIL